MGTKNTHSLLHFLKYPYVFTSNLKERGLTILSFTIYIVFCVYFLSRFGLNDIQENDILSNILHSICLLIVLIGINFFIIKTNKKFFNEDKWTVARELKWLGLNVLFIGLINASYALISVDISLISKTQIMKFEFFTMVIGFVPMTLMIILNEVRCRNEINKSAEKLNAKLNSFTKLNKSNRSKKDESVVFEIYDQQVKSLILLKDLIYIHSDNSGFQLVTSSSNKLSNLYVHSDLNSINSKLFKNEELLQCHPQFIVNMDKIIHVSGNARGYKLHLKNTKTQVPVSMKHKKDFERLIV